MSVGADSGMCAGQAFRPFVLRLPCAILRATVASCSRVSCLVIRAWLSFVMIRVGGFYTGKRFSGLGLHSTFIPVKLTFLGFLQAGRVFLPEAAVLS
jgi:hypothetical protein